MKSRDADETGITDQVDQHFRPNRHDNLFRKVNPQGQMLFLHRGDAAGLSGEVPRIGLAAGALTAGALAATSP
jgi:hypothetical protein